MKLINENKKINRVRKSLKESTNIDTQKLADFIEKAIKGLQNEDATNYRFKLDDRLAVFVGWSDGYDEDDDTVIHSEESPSWGINAGVKVWTSDDMWTDYDYLNFPYYKDGDVYDTGFTIAPNNDPVEIAKDLIKEYNNVKNLEIDEDGLILESTKTNKHYKSLKEDTYDLGTQFDKRQSFYGKAKVVIDKDGNKVLYSYNEPVCKITKTGEVLLGDAWNFSSTTLRHIKEFLNQNNKTVGTKKDIGKMYRVTNLKESKRNLKEDVSSYAISSAIYDVLGALEDDFQDVVEDIVDRAMTSIDEGSDREDAIYEAMDEGLIYTADEWAMIEHYCDPHSANYDDAYSGLMSDVESVIDQIIEDRDDDEDDEEFDESLKESKEEDYVLYKEGDTIYGTPKSNYNIQYANGNLIRNYTKSGFKSVEDIKKYLTKYSKNNVRIIDKTNESLKRKVASRRK